jgi:pimeloyl-ACP methyl ester carboxylesterase
MEASMIDTPEQALESIDRTPQSGRWRRPLQRTAVVVGVLALLFYVGGGWYFSSQLGDDAFVVDHSSGDDDDLTVTAITGEAITLAAPDGDEPTLATPGVNGFEHAGGRLLLGDVIESRTDADSDVVTREYSVLTGTAPAAGDVGDLDSWVYPDDPTFVFPGAQSITFESDLGQMGGWYVPGDGDRWVIFVHGKGATPRETLRMMDTIGSMPMLSIRYRNDEGMPPDPSGFYRYGVTEWTDVEAAVEWALDAGADEIVLAGFSTGAAADLSFMYRSELADRVVGLLLDAPNIDFGRVVDYGASRRSLPLIGLPVPQSLTTVAKFIGALRFDVDWSALDYIDDIEEIDVPILVFHGTDDTTVPLDVSERLAEASPDLVTLEVFDGAEHVQSWNADPGEYEAAVQQFLADL